MSTAAASAGIPQADSGAGMVDVSRVLDEARFGPVQCLVLAFTFCALVMDGFDIQAIAFAAPVLTELWGIERSALGPVLAAGLLGMALGAGSIGPLGDRRGRREALMVSCLLMAVGSLASVYAAGPWQLAIFRFVTGVGLGGAMPNATALMFEFAPKRWRQIATSIALVGVPLGGLFGAALARKLVPEFGWQSLFVVGGAAPALLAWAMRLALPESPRYLSSRGDRGGELAGLLNRIAGAQRYRETARFVSGGTAPNGASAVAAIFARGYRRDTLILWVILFTNVFAVYFFWNWLPTVLAAANLDFGIAVSGSFYFNLGGVFATLITSVLIARYGSRSILALLGIAAVASVLSIAANSLFGADRATGSVTTLMWSMTAAGSCMNALQIGMFSVAAHVYPTAVRSTGVGWALAVARFGGIVSSFVGAGLFAFGLQSRGFFLFVGGTLVLTFLSVIALGRHIPAESR